MSKVDPARIPAASAPPGFTSNLENPITKDNSAGVVLAIVGMVFASFFLGMRVYTKAFLARLFGIDDVLLIFAWMLSLVVQITIVHSKANAVIGTHIWDLSLTDFVHLARITTIDSVLYLVVMACCKISILLFYLKLSREKWFTYAIYATMGLVISFSASLTLALIFACTPLKRVWDVTITDGHCVNQGKIYLATAGLNAASDIIMLFLPMPMLKKLQVPLPQKIGLMAIFSIGSATMVTSLIRLSLMPPLIKAADMSWQLATPSTWICVEGNLVVICGCLPILRLFLRHVAPRLIGESTYASGSNSRRQKPDNGSSELSNLERSKRSMHSHGRKSQYDVYGEDMGRDDGSLICIVNASCKPVMATDTTDLEAAEHVEAPPLPPPPRNYSQLHRDPDALAPMSFAVVGGVAAASYRSHKESNSIQLSFEAASGPAVGQ